MGNPLDQQAPWSGKLIQSSSYPAKVGHAQTSQLSMNNNATVSGLFTSGRRAPDMNRFAFSDQTCCNYTRVIAHTTEFRWILACDQMPGGRIHYCPRGRATYHRLLARALGRADHRPAARVYRKSRCILV